MDAEAVVNELQHQIKMRTLEIKRELDTTVINGISYGATGDIEARTMMGIINFLRDPDLDMTREDTLITDNNGAALTVAQLNTLMYNVWAALMKPEVTRSIIATPI